MLRRLLPLLLLLTLPALSTAQPTPHPDFAGTWTLLPAQSTDIDLYRTLTLTVEPQDDAVTLIQTWGTRRSFTDSLTLRTDGSIQRVPILDRVFASNVFMGLSMPVGDERRMTAAWSDDGTTLTLTEDYEVRASQGRHPVTATHTYALSPEEDVVTYTITRSTRPTIPPIRYVLKRAGTREAYMMRLADDWRIDSGLPTNALLISLQAHANQDGPRLYFVYPDAWDYRFTPTVLDYYRDERYYTFDELRGAEQALDTFNDQVEGYVVWDPEVRTSLIVAFTVAGLEHAIVVTEDQIPMVEAAGLEQVEDFRDTFTGMNDAEIYQWAADRYWERTSKEVIVWMGGEHGAIMKPGVADYGIYRNAFFNDLSALPSDSAEYALADRLLSEMEPMSLVMGWHSYKKDKERDHVALTSSHGLRVEGLHTLPNMSFSSQIPPSPGFTFQNNHNVHPDSTYVPEEKVYITPVQTDGLGLGAWTRPGRGDLPYAWEVTMNWQWLAPAMLEYFYSQATPNDFFVGGLSGPGYMYPKAVPEDALPTLLDEASRLMQTLDLNVFSIMDYSEGATVEGNTELTEQVVDAYYEAMPDALGFINGYAPAYTFTVRDGVPFLSYDYYLSPARDEADAVADLKELIAINDERPYFLLLHVRQWSDITRVQSILDQIDAEVVPLDVFLKLAGNAPTYQERFLNQP